MTLTRREILSMGCTLAIAEMLPHVAISQHPSNSHAAAVTPDKMLAYVNPEFRPWIEARLKAAGGHAGTGLNSSTLPAVREAMRTSFGRPPLPSPPVQERMIPGSAGAPKVRIYIVGAEPGASKPAILHMHGGGYVAGTAGMQKRDLQEMSMTHNCVVVSVDYRLAPETPFPGSLEDNYAGLRWLYRNANELGVDTRRIAIKGESAGGGHAAALAIAARDRGEIPICLQVLIYPMLDDRTGSTRHLPPYIGYFSWNEEANRFGWSSLLGVPAGSNKVPPGAVPARVSSVAGLPPAFIGVGSIDLFGPEDIEYASRLILAGVSTELHVVPGAYHGFDVYVPQAPLSIQFTAAWNAALKRAFTTA